MTRDELIAKAIESLEAIRDGKTLQQKQFGAWIDLSSEDWLRNAETIRIKPEPVLRPWTEAEIEAECVKGTVLQSVPIGNTCGALSRNGNTYYVGVSAVCHRGQSEYLKEHYVIAATGAPCGVYETPEAVAPRE